MPNNKTYLEKLFQFKDSFSVKVITGIRGIGKTSLLSMFADALKNDGVPSEEIIYINFEEDEHIFDFQQLYEVINEKISYLERAYLLFDEIQQVKGWEKAINAFFVGSPVDIYIADSNSGVLSDVFLNLLSDNYEVINLQPLSFEEYLHLMDIKNDEDSIKKYLKFGGLPIVTKFRDQEELLPMVLSGIYYTIVNKDIIARYGIRDAKLLDSINKCLALNIGNSITPKIIETYLKNIGQITTLYTMENYFRMINECGLFHRIPRYDIKNKLTVNGSEQFYCADLGILNMLSNFADYKNEAIAENVIFIELLRRGYTKIFVGKIGNIKISFVAIKDSKPIYIQIVSTIGDKENLRKVARPLQHIKDQYDKIIVSLERPKINDYNGIKFVYIWDFINEAV